MALISVLCLISVKLPECLTMMMILDVTRFASHFNGDISNISLLSVSSLVVRYIIRDELEILLNAYLFCMYHHDLMVYLLPAYQFDTFFFLLNREWVFLLPISVKVDTFYFLILNHFFAFLGYISFDHSGLFFFKFNWIEFTSILFKVNILKMGPVYNFISFFLN